MISAHSVVISAQSVVISAQSVVVSAQSVVKQSMLEYNTFFLHDNINATINVHTRIYFII